MSESSRVNTTAAPSAAAPWLSPIVKKRKNNTGCKEVIPVVSPILNWLQTGNARSDRHKRLQLSVPARSYKSSVTNYHDDPKNPAPGDLIMCTAEAAKHPAYTMKESIGAAFLLFGKVKHFTYKRYPEGVKELMTVDWSYLPNDPRVYEVPPILYTKVTLLSKRNSYDLDDVNEFLRDAVDCHWELDRVSGWEKLM